MTGKKQEIINHHESFNQWIDSLRRLDDEQWLQPIQPGKWSTGEIVCHFIYWDRYFLDQRLPLMKQGAELPPGTGTETFNTLASIKARNELSTDTVLNLLMDLRREIIQVINNLSEEELRVVFFIGENKLTLTDYLEGLMEHDLHHRSQIVTFLQGKGEPV